jgi:asparagine synthetase B (glutamine-hydrolysing)
MGDTDELWNSLDGIFACVLVDERTGEFCAARDPMGICSFYWGRGADGSYWFASELKSLQDNCDSFDIFPPVGASPAGHRVLPTTVIECWAVAQGMPCLGSHLAHNI